MTHPHMGAWQPVLQSWRRGTNRRTTKRPTALSSWARGTQMLRSSSKPCCGRVHSLTESGVLLCTPDAAYEHPARLQPSSRVNSQQQPQFAADTAPASPVQRAHAASTGHRGHNQPALPSHAQQHPQSIQQPPAPVGGAGCGRACRCWRRRGGVSGWRPTGLLRPAPQAWNPHPPSACRASQPPLPGPHR